MLSGPSLNIRPLAGFRVRDPETRAVLEEDVPVEVLDSSYWRRRIAEGSVEVESAPKKTRTKRAQPKE